jgi:hypothetical protein
MKRSNLPRAGSQTGGESYPPYPEWENTVWQGEWRSSAYCECETRPSVVQSSRGFHTALADSYGGGDCTPSYHHEAYPTQEQAIAKALSREARWHREAHEPEETGETNRHASLSQKMNQKNGRSR